MKERNTKVTMHEDTLEDNASFLTEFAQMQRVVGNHEKAARAEAIRNTIYQQKPASI